jgi:uncharacterized OsmC-like protein
MTNDTADTRRFDVWATREGTRVYRGHNARGASVLMGADDVPGAFTPGELLSIALAGCTGMTADSVLVRHLTSADDISIGVEATAHQTQERYTGFDETVLVDLVGLDDAARQQLATAVGRAVKTGCTVGLTLLEGAQVAVTIGQR